MRIKPVSDEALQYLQPVKINGKYCAECIYLNEFPTSLDSLSRIQYTCRLFNPMADGHRIQYRENGENSLRCDVCIKVFGL